MDKELLKTTRQAVKSGGLDSFIDLVETHEGLLEEVTVFGSWLHVASAHGQIEIVKYLVQKGLDINLIGSIGDNGPIGEAAFRGHLDIV
jgi:uncharacterized protein